VAGKIELIGNEGFRISIDNRCLLIDAFYHHVPSVASSPVALPAGPAVKVILVTHAHWDHFDPHAVARAAQHHHAVVIGPRSVTQALASLLPTSHLLTASPKNVRRGETPNQQTLHLGDITVTAYRTFHNRDHNSYLIDFAGLRIFHDGDNEFTQTLPLTDLRPLDAMLIAPWQGSSWAEFIRNVNPRQTFIMHLTESEIADHRRGEFFPGLVDELPPNLTVLAPGESATL